MYNCSGNCLNGVACNRTTGKCDAGCDYGYTGVLCKTGMIQLNEDLQKMWMIIIKNDIHNFTEMQRMDCKNIIQGNSNLTILATDIYA